jgi:protoheme IX farnesyltransferase
MATESMVADPPAAIPREGAVWWDYWALTKPDVNLLIGITTAAGFCLGRPLHDAGFPFLRLAHTVLGTLLVAGGTGTLNQWMERRFDALMRRTARRPVADGRIDPASALAFGALLCTGGISYLAGAVNALAAGIALLTMASYLLVYTPLKRATPLCTMVGAIPGAAPPLIGWAAAAGSLSLEAWLLYAMVFLWQFPHFMSIAWMYRADYDRAGFAVLPKGKAGALAMTWQVGAPLILLLLLSMAPVALGRAGSAYLATALVLGAGFAYRAFRQVLQRSNVVSRQLLFASIVYLPLIFVVMILDRI